MEFKLKKNLSKQYVYIDRVPYHDKAYGVEKKINKHGIKKEDSRTIRHFEEIMRQVDFDTSFLYRDFRGDMLELRKGNDIGSYDAKKRKLIVDPDDRSATFYRALLDLTLRKEYSSFTICGFERWVRDSSGSMQTHIGYGLQKGYKDVFMNRYFGIPYRYPELADIARLVEMIIGQEKMESLFEQGDLKAINSYLKKNSFLMKMDILYDRLYKQGLIGVARARNIYSGVLVTLATDAMMTARDKSKDAIFQAWDPVDELWMYTVYEGDLDLAVAMMQEVQTIVRKYVNPTFGSVRLAEEDQKRIEESRKYYTLASLNDVVPGSKVKVLRDKSRNRICF